jgi:ATP-dependent HslUV protease subunit HslV
MSIIVWDGKTLAADSQATNENLGYGKMSKIWRHGDVLLAGVGQSQALLAIRNWIECGAEPSTFPKEYMDRTERTCMWVINRNGTIARIEDGPFLLQRHDKMFADGSGRDFAYGAMEMGADAEAAVRVACKFDIYCGGGIDTLTFDD